MRRLFLKVGRIVSSFKRVGTPIPKLTKRKKRDSYSEHKHNPFCWYLENVEGDYFRVRHNTDLYLRVKRN